jgi:hypothetical protein
MPAGDKGAGMAERIGNVLYWLGCIVAGLTALLGVAIYLAEGHNKYEGLLVMGFVFICACIPWLKGRACRYVLAGR